MAIEVIMPALGMAQDTGLLIAWLKNEGDSVEKGEPLMEVETDKATVEVEANASGVLGGVSAQAGDDVPVGDVIAYILAHGEDTPVSATPKSATPETKVVTSQETAAQVSGTEGSLNSDVKATPVAQRMASVHDVDLAKVPTQNKRVTKSDVTAFLDGQNNGTGTSIILASPKAKRLAREKNIELVLITGSGPDGAIIAEDVLNYVPPAPAQQAQPVAASSTNQDDRPVETGHLWKRMAERLTESWQTVPHFYLKRGVFADGLMTWRKNILDRSGVKVTYTDLLVKCVAASLKQHPHLNGMWNGEGVVFNEEVNVGLAVAVDQGLLVPVIHNADTLGVKTLTERRKEVVNRSLEGRLKPRDLQDGTFTISNLGMFGIDNFDAIVNPPQSAILAVGRITERAVPLNGEVVIRPMMTLTLSCDHRAVDGARGAQFLDTLCNLLENPLGLLD